MDLRGSTNFFEQDDDQILNMNGQYYGLMVTNLNISDMCYKQGVIILQVDDMQWAPQISLLSHLHFILFKFQSWKHLMENPIHY